MPQRPPEPRQEDREIRMSNPTAAACGDSDRALAAVRQYLQNLRFGTIALVVHDGRVVQLDVTEKRRLAR